MCDMRLAPAVCLGMTHVPREHVLNDYAEPSLGTAGWATRTHRRAVGATGVAKRDRGALSLGCGWGYSQCLGYQVRARWV